MLQVALNGDRSPAEHSAVPRSPDELAADARACVAEGARVLHLHVFEGESQTLAAGPTSTTLRAVRSACSAPISLTTSAEVEPDPERRLASIAAWTELPDLVTANQGEDGIVELCEQLIARGVGIEAGLLERSDAEAFVESGLAERSARALVEPLGEETEAALMTAAAIEQVLAEADVELEQVHHGDGPADWSVSVRGLGHGHGIRTGLEDTTVLPTGEHATDNAELVRVAAALLGYNG
jgi:uncharacterized protein (DUF849 family)